MSDKEKLLNSSLSFTYKILKSNVLNMVLPPLTKFEERLSAIRFSDDGEAKRIDFQLIEIEGKIIFQFIPTMQAFGFDIDELHDNKITFVAENNKGLLFTVSDIDSLKGFEQYL